MCARKEPLLLIGDPRQLLWPDLITKLPRVLRIWSTLRQPQSFCQLENLLGKRGIPVQTTGRHLMWLLKYGLASLVKD